MKLNLGCGNRKLDGFINVDRFENVSPDILCDLEIFPWSWENNSIEEIKMFHCLEHLGQTKEVYINIFKEIYRICCNNAKIEIIVPHFRNDKFWNDPTHVRVVTVDGLQLFSQKFNKWCIEKNAPNSILGLQYNIDFDIVNIEITPSSFWHSITPKKDQTLDRLMHDVEKYNNMAETINIILQVIK